MKETNISNEMIQNRCFRMGPRGAGGASFFATFTLALFAVSASTYADFSISKSEAPLWYFQWATHGAIVADNTHTVTFPGAYWRTPFKMVELTGLPGDGVSVGGDSRHLIAPHAGEAAPGPRHRYTVALAPGATAGPGVTSGAVSQTLAHGGHNDTFVSTLAASYIAGGQIIAYAYASVGWHPPPPPGGGGAIKKYSATLKGIAQVPPNDSEAVGAVALALEPSETALTMGLAVQGITLTDLVGSAIHAGTEGINGPAIFDLGGGDDWIDLEGLGIARMIENAEFPAQYVEALLSGETYVSLQTFQYPDGEIRGQLVPAPLACPADFDGDGNVGASDLAQVLGGWGVCLPEHPCIPDMDGDGDVDAADLAAVLGGWGACPDPGPICGNGIVEDGEDCDPVDDVACDENCLYSLFGCCWPFECVTDVYTPGLCLDLGGTPVTDCAAESCFDTPELIFVDLRPPSISIEPTPDGMVIVSVPTQVLVSAPEPVPDIETFAEIRVNGLAVDVVPLSVDLPAEAGLCYFSAWPACDGSCPFSVPCKPFPAPPEICYCEYYTLVLATVPANAGDLITVVLDSPDLVHEVDEQNNEISGVVPGGGGHTGDCCSANDTPGCDDPECQEMICSINPWCCDVQWDEICAGEAAKLCEVCGANCFSVWNDCHGAATDQTCAACLQGPVPLGVSWLDANGICHTTCP